MSSIAWPTIMRAIQKFVKDATGFDDAHALWAFYDAPRPPAPWVEMNFQENRNPAHDWTTVALNVLQFPDQLVTSVDVPGSRLVVPNHPLVTGDGPVQIQASTPPGGLSLDTDYWVIAPDAGHVQLADEYAKTGGNYPGNPITPVTLSSAGVGPIKIVEQPETVRAGQELVKTAKGMREIHLEIQVFGPLKSGFLAFQIASDIVAALPLHIYELDLAGVGVSDLGTSFVQGSVRSTPGNRGELLEPRATVDMVVYVASELVAFSTYIQTVQGKTQMTMPDGTSLPESDFTVRSPS